jgi:hypothetical protein
MILTSQKLPTDQNASQSEKCFVDVGAFLIADAQPTKLVQPGKSSFHDPSPSAKSTAVLGIPHREQWQNAAAT